ncbi:hypothetical protein IKA92_00335, partial [bacterium]|nr:hypothetical protein [bacterium]
AAIGSLPVGLLFGAGPVLKDKIFKKGKKDVIEQQAKNAGEVAKNASEAGKAAVKEKKGIAKLLKLDKLGNWFKGTKLGKTKLVQNISKLNIGSFFAFNMLFQLGEIIPAFKDGGIKGGVKQIGKSVVKGGADAIAYAGGMKLGATIGSVGGPVGSAIGAVAGIVLGGVFSTVAGKVCKLFVGKDHSEKKADKEKDETAKQLAQDSASLAELKTAVEAKVMEKAESGKLTADDIAILEQAQTIQVADNKQDGQVAFKGAEEAKQAQPIGTVTKPAPESDEQIMARLQKIPEGADLGIEYEVPANYSWTTSV